MSDQNPSVSWITPRSQWRSRRGEKRTVPMKVLVLGFPRTGTASIQQALQMLGFAEVYHMRAVFANPPDAEMWDQVLGMKQRGERVGREIWDEILGHCQAVTDAPCAIYAEDLLAAYPDAKVILTLRDPERWWVSYARTVNGMLRHRLFAFAVWLDSGKLGLGRVASVAFTHVDQLVGHAPTAAEAQARFVAHYELVRRRASGRLLEFDVKVAGWAELCAFLEVPVPEGVEYPHVNDAAEFQATLTANALTSLRRLAGDWLPFVIPPVALFLALSVRRVSRG